MLRSFPARAPQWRARCARIAASLLFLVATGCGKDADHLVASVERIDFGLVAHGRDSEQRVKVTNEGRHSVVLTAAAPSCACLAVDPTFQRSLRPDESTELIVRLTTAHVPAQKLEGKYISVRSDDAAVPELKIPVYGEIEARLTVAPKIIVISAADGAGRGQPRRIKMRIAPGYPAAVTKVEVLRTDWFAHKEERQPDGSIDIVLTVKPDPARRGPVDTFVRLFVTVTGKGLPPVNYEEMVLVKGTW
jgi:hypothetical protein